MTELVAIVGGKAGGEGGSPVARRPKFAPLTIEMPDGSKVTSLFSVHCRVCRSPYGAEINRLAMMGHGAINILAILPKQALEGKDPMTKSTVHGHLKRHLDLDSRRIVQELAQYAEAKGAEMDGTLVPPAMFAREMLHRAWKKSLDNPNWTPNMSEAIGFAKLIVDYDRQIGDQPDTILMAHVVSSMVIIAQRIMPPEMYERWMAGVRSDPAVKAVIEAERRRSEQAALPAYATAGDSQD